MEKITSSKNQLIKELRSLEKRASREETGLFLVEGEVMINEALKCGLKIRYALCTDSTEAFAQALPCEAKKTTPEIMKQVCATVSPQGVCAAFELITPLEINKLPDKVVALDGVQDPGNAGTIWRTADAAGMGALLFGAGCADPLSPKVQRAAMGSGFRLPFSATPSLPGALEELKRLGYTIICSDLHGENFYSRPSVGDKYVLVIGNEAAGISDETRNCASVLLKLPMRGGAESLNAAVAAGIMMYELTREN